MITTARIATRKEAALRLPAFVVALAIAETWFRFHSFALECLAFLPVWAALDGLTSLVMSNWVASRRTTTDGDQPSR